MADPRPLALPAPRVDGGMALMAALDRRRSCRDHAPSALSLEAIAQLLWAAQGVTSPKGLTAPSAGALYPLEVYLVAGWVTGLPAGSYRYDASGHRLMLRVAGDLRRSLARAALGQSGIAEAPAAVVIAGVYRRTTGKYGERGVRYVHMEVGGVQLGLFTRHRQDVALLQRRLAAHRQDDARTPQLGGKAAVAAHDLQLLDWTVDGIVTGDDDIARDDLVVEQVRVEDLAADAALDRLVIAQGGDDRDDIARL